MAVAGQAVVLMVADDAKTAGALAMLIEDWGFGVISAAAQDQAALPCDVAAIVMDLVRTRPRLSWLLRHRIPTLILVNSEAGLAGGTFADHAAVLAKPVAPHQIRAWLEGVVKPSGRV
jgi:hypothetical protein